jgi:hypothetical protein
MVKLETGTLEDESDFSYSLKRKWNKQKIN